MTIADVITSDAARRSTRGRRAAFVAECVLYPASAAVFATMFTLLWTFDAGPGFLEPGGLAALVVVLLLVAAAAVGALHRYRRPDRAVAVGLVVLAVEAVGLVAPLGPSPLSLLGWMLETGPGPVLLGAVVRRARPAVGFLAGAVSVAVAVALGSFVPQLDDGNPVLRVYDLGPAVVIALVPVLTGVVLRSLDTARRTADLARVRAEERLQVARELHDMVGNHVTGMTMYAQVAAADADVPDRVRELLTAIESRGGDALTAMRRMVVALRSDDGVGDLDVMPPRAGTLQGAVHEAAAATPGVTVAVEPGLGDPAPDVVATVHRVVVEALPNVRRHAPRASTVDAGPAAAPDGRLAVEVVNDGVGRSRGDSSGLGLTGLRERLAALDGSLEAGPAGPGRWRLRAELPHRRSPDRRDTAGLV